MLKCGKDKMFRYLKKIIKNSKNVNAIYRTHVVYYLASKSNFITSNNDLQTSLLRFWELLA